MSYHLLRQNSFVRIIVAIATITLISFNANSQSSIKGIVTDKNQQSLANASVALLMAKDSSLVKGS